MGTLSFMPWVGLSEPQRIGAFQLTPWPMGCALPQVAKILSAYRDPSGNEIREAMLIHPAEDPVVRPLSADDRADVFDLGMVLTFTGLARRELCGKLPFGYANADSFYLVVQSFSDEDPGAISTVSRRRGGRLMAGYAPGVFQQRMSPHVERKNHYAFDASLAASLLGAFASPVRVAYEEALFSFNSANTDSPQVPEQHELVALAGAFERLVERSGDAETMVAAVIDLVGGMIPNERPQHLRRLNVHESQHGAFIRKTNTRIISPTLMHAWLRDLYRVRNAFGHGRREYDRVAAWRLQSHLLLGAYLFPLAVMARLERDGFYKLTPDDKAKLAAFPWLVSLREPLRWRLRHGGVWNWAMEKAAEAERMRRALAALP